MDAASSFVAQIYIRMALQDGSSAFSVCVGRTVKMVFRPLVFVAHCQCKEVVELSETRLVY